MIPTSTFRATRRYAAMFVALAMQVVAVAVIGDVFASAPRADAGLPPPNDVVARAAPAARGEHLMTIDLAFVPKTSPPEAPPAPDADMQPAALVAAEAAPEPEQSTIVEPTPQPRLEPTPAPRPQPTPPPPTLAPPPPRAAPSSGTTREAELRMLALMNESRLQGGLAPLALDAGVSDTARRHSAAEAQYGYVYHDGPDGTAASRDVPACGTGWYGENTGKVWSGGVDALHREFMAEPWAPINHRTNIMDPNFRRAGIGAVQGPEALYITVVFCR